MLKRHQIERIFPLTAAIVSLYIFIKHYNLSVMYLLFLAISITGCIIWWFGVLNLGEAFSTIPKARKLIKQSIYSKIRHPIYIGLLLVLIGWCYVINSIIFYALVLVVILVLVFRAYFEERKLIEVFGEEYLKYKKETWF